MGEERWVQAKSKEYHPAGGGGGNSAAPRTLTTTPPSGPLANSQRCRPQSSMGARRSMNTKGALREILSTLHPNTILKPNVDSNAHPQSSAYS